MTTEIERAAHAQAILDNPEFQAAFDDIETGIIDRWKATSVTDTEAQTYLKLLLKIHGDYLHTLKRRITDGTIKEIKIERQNKIASMFRK